MHGTEQLFLFAYPPIATRRPGYSLQTAWGRKKLLKELNAQWVSD
jgi:hypothetical protein